MERYFKNELLMIEFALLELSGKKRNEILKVDRLYFRDTKVAKEKREVWGNRIIELLNKENDIEVRERCIEEFSMMLREIRGY